MMSSNFINFSEKKNSQYFNWCRKKDDDKIEDRE